MKLSPRKKKFFRLYIVCTSMVFSGWAVYVTARLLVLAASMVARYMSSAWALVLHAIPFIG